MPDPTNRDGIRWLQTRSKELQAIIESQQLDSELDIGPPDEDSEGHSI